MGIYTETKQIHLLYACISSFFILVNCRSLFLFFLLIYQKKDIFTPALSPKRDLLTVNVIDIDAEIKQIHLLYVCISFFFKLVDFQHLFMTFC